MPKVKCSQFPVRPVIIDGKHINGLAFKKEHFRVKSMPDKELELVFVKVNKEITYGCLEAEDFVEWCTATGREGTVSEKDLHRHDRNGKCFLVAITRYDKEQRGFQSLNVKEKSCS